MSLKSLDHTVDALAGNSDRQFAAVHEEIEKLAVSTAHEFESIRGEMPTKSDFERSHKEVLRAIDSLDMHLSATQSHWNDDFDGLHRTTKDHEERLRFLEKRHRLAR